MKKITFALLTLTLVSCGPQKPNKVEECKTTGMLTPMPEGGYIITLTETCDVYGDD